ncbi:hypothetical protein KAX35_04270, partial [candidate division WOR-3 bacterium]|nr:hypothetical protein [candidate division WOR-3 bacterium]
MHIFIFIFLSLINIPQPTEKIDNNKKVTDNTRGWFIQETGIGQAILDIFFIDSLNGWAVEKYGKIIHTSDGGYSWERQYCREQRRLYTIGFRNNSEGWAGGSKSEYGFDFYVLLLHTIDAGSTWIELKSNNPPLYNWIKDISIPNTTCGYYLQCFYYFCEVSSSIYNIVTGNCEISWWIPEAMCGEKIHFIDSLCGWYLSTAFRGDSQCYLFSTQTGPENLNLIDSFSISIKNIFFVDSLKGWIVGESGTILHTEDAGTTWVTQLSGINNTLNGIDFVDSLNGWIVGEGGVILRTRDGGEHWT